MDLHVVDLVGRGSRSSSRKRSSGRLVLDQHNRQLELTLVSTYLEPLSPFCYSN